MDISPIFILLLVIADVITPGFCFWGGMLGSRTSTTTETSVRHRNTDRKQFRCEETRVAPRVSWAIIGGSPIRDKFSVPYMAAIGERLANGTTTWFCGGSLVSENVVLTAAHCLARKVDVVRLGGKHLNMNAEAQDVAVAASKIHPEYKNPRSYHDIALLRLETSASLSKGVKPICLANKNAGHQPGEITSVMGWGVGTNGGDGTEELHKVKVKVFSNPECSRIYSRSPTGQISFPRGITDEQLCAGTPEGGKDSCQGDSGGPLVVQDDQGVIRQLGIVSAGTGCGLKKFPGVYIRVSAYIDWINKFL